MCTLATQTTADCFSRANLIIEFKNEEYLPKFRGKFIRDSLFNLLFKEVGFGLISVKSGMVKANRRVFNN
jgi:hypothetical protein